MLLSKYMSKYQVELIIVSILTITITSMFISAHNAYSCDNGTYVETDKISSCLKKAITDHKSCTAGGDACNAKLYTDTTNCINTDTRCNTTNFGFVFSIIVLVIACLVLVSYPVLKFLKL